MRATTTRKNVKATTTTAEDVKDTITRARLHYGCAGPKLMGKLAADGFQGATLAERVKAWALSHPAAAPTVSDEPTATTANEPDEPTDLEPAAVASDEPTTTTDEPADLEPAAPTVSDFPAVVSDEPAAAPVMPEPELILADEPAAAPVLATVPAVVSVPAVVVPVPVPMPTIPAAGSTRTQPAGRASGGGTDLTDAHRQWANRPADERYWTIADALQATTHHRDTAREVSFPWDAVSLAPSDDGADIVLHLPDGTGATLTHYAAGQLARTVGAPMAYLAKLPTDLAVSCLEHGLTVAHGGKDKGGNALIHQNGHTKLRSLTSDRYARFWNCEVFQALEPLTSQGWRTPPARPAGVNDPRSRRAEPADCLKRSGQFWGTVKPGDWIAPSGIYASSHDMFAFLINEDMRIDDGTEDGLARGFFISNSEVGAGALKLKAFYYRDVCSNHIVWGAEHVVEVNVRHVGTFDSIRQKFALQVRGALDSFTRESMEADQLTVTRARNYMLTTATDPATARKEVLNALISGVSGGRTLKPASGISVGMFEKSLDLAVQFADIDKVHPYSLWGAVNGLTRYSQTVGADYADERARVDSLTGKLMKLVGATDTTTAA